MYTLPKLTYKYVDLEPVIDSKTMEIHHTKHHGGYVAKLNEAVKDHSEFKEMDVYTLLKKINSIPKSIKNSVINNGGGHANHTLFWEIIKPPTSDNNNPSEGFKKTLGATFGSLDEFKKEFANTATSRFGSGWAWLVINNEKLEIYSTKNQDSPYMEGKTPILGLDVWEHAYYLNYQNKRADYVNAFWEIVNWEKVESNYTTAQSS